MSKLTDKTFIDAFENKTLAPEHFDHTGHLRVAWYYLTRFPLDIAVLKVCFGIKGYADSLGATQKFHLTLTYGFLMLINKRLSTDNSNQFPVFIEENPDLVTNANLLLSKHYSPEILDSDKARSQLLLPDRIAF